MRKPSLMGALLLAGITTAAQQPGARGVLPPRGFVPDTITAVRVAEAILAPIYGEQQIAREKPFKATLNEGTWAVRGTLAAGRVGGVATVKIAKQDGRILFVWHSK